MEAAAAQAAGGAALVLGVTPELVGMRWPAGVRVTAADRSRDVIDAVFAPAPHAEAVCADWRALPAADGAYAIAVGDGSLSNLDFPGGYRAVAAELARVVDGPVVLRLFAAPARAESLGAIAADLGAGRIGSFHALKWRLAMAVQPPEANVRVSDIAAAFDELVADRAALVARTGWPRAVVDAIDVYRGSAVTYSFPTEAAATAALAPHWRPVARHVPGYELGARCPTIVLAR